MSDRDQRLTKGPSSNPELGELVLVLGFFAFLSAVSPKREGWEFL